LSVTEGFSRAALLGGAAFGAILSAPAASQDTRHMSTPSDSDSSQSPERNDNEDQQLALSAAYEELQRLLIDSTGVTDFLDQVAHLAASVIAGSSCGITLRRGGEVATVASSDRFATQVDEIQYGRGQGPCLEAMNTSTEVLVEDMATEQRWGDYRMHALTYGVRSSVSMPLRLDNEAALGALNLYSQAAYGFSARDTTRARDFARQAGTALSLVVRRAERTKLEDQLRDALATRAVIDQAMGIVMGQRQIGSAEAFTVLREASQAQNRKLSHVAADLIESITGQPPQPPRPFTSPR
jgi:GAF domain-containing protein